tara:strand:+ start:10936 stop:11616 length:681 start_codon:yes stop_codon:yes gene_type:complete
MPLPVIAAVILIVAGLSTAAVVTLNWDYILIALKGKRITVLGERGVGKTTLVQFLTSGTLPTDVAQTLAPEKNPGRRFALKDLDLKVKDITDVSGSEDAYAEWKKQVLGADMILYLLRADLVNQDDPAVTKRTLKDLKHLGDWLEGTKRRPRLFIIGTHCDLDEKFKRLSPANKGDYLDEFTRNSVVRQLISHGGGQAQATVLLGSLKSEAECEAVVHDILKRLIA